MNLAFCFSRSCVPYSLSLRLLRISCLLDFLSYPRKTGSRSRDLHLFRTGVLFTAIVLYPFFPAANSLRTACSAQTLPGLHVVYSTENIAIFSVSSSKRVKIHVIQIYDHTLLLLGGRHPLWGTGVTSVMLMISRPLEFSARIAASLPDPGPLTKTSTAFSP